jgi:hypothetical protein
VENVPGERPYEWEPLTGTTGDRQYSSEGGAQGTDSQYMGVQFGPSEYPAEKPAKEKRRLLFMQGFSEDLVQIVQYEANKNNPRFGMPVMYRVTLNDPREQHSGIGLPLATVRVHWSRVIHLADNRNCSRVFGVPRCRPVLNRLIDCQKLYGASAEGYWKSCFNLLSFETHPQLGGDVDVDGDQMRDDVEQVFNSLQRFLLAKGGSWKSIAPAVLDPGGFIDKQIEAICICIGCPKRVFMGSERGELASSQDDASWNDRLRHRQNSYLTPKVIAPLVDRLIAAGVLPEPEGYSVEWPDLDSLTEKDKAAIAAQRTAALAQYVQGGCNVVVPEVDFLTDFLDVDDDRAEEYAEDAAKAAEQKLEDEQAQQDEQDQQSQDLADEHGYQPAPPEGFRDAPAEPDESAEPDQEANAFKAQQKETEGEGATENAETDAYWEKLTYDNYRRQIEAVLDGGD